jgi:hypothetical protein
MAHPTNHATRHRPTQSYLTAVQQGVTVLLLWEQMTLNLQMLQDATTPNLTYAGEFKKGSTWVKHTGRIGECASLFSCENIDHYCMHHIIVYKKGKPDNVYTLVIVLHNGIVVLSITIGPHLP